VLARLQPKDGRDLTSLVSGEEGPLGGRGIDEEAMHRVLL
jgi:hypothetical protein